MSTWLDPKVKHYSGFVYGTGSTHSAFESVDRVKEIVLPSVGRPHPILRSPG